MTFCLDGAQVCAEACVRHARNTFISTEKLNLHSKRQTIY